MMERQSPESVRVTAFILSGGQGTRLRSVLPDKQKVVASVAGQPFILRLIEAFHCAGISRIVLGLGYRSDDVMKSLEGLIPAGVEIVPSIEEQPLGTGGALRHALPLIDSDTLLVANGDSYVDCDLGAFLAFHRRTKAKISMLLCDVPDISRYGSVSLGADNQIQAFMEKNAEAQCGGVINAGVYLIERSIVSDFPLGKVSLERDIFPTYCGMGLYGMRQGGRFIDIGTPEDYGRAEEFFGTPERRML